MENQTCNVANLPLRRYRDSWIDNGHLEFMSVYSGVRALVISIRSAYICHKCCSVERLLHHVFRDYLLSSVAFVTKFINDEMNLGISSRDSLDIYWLSVDAKKSSYSLDVLFSLCRAICSLRTGYDLSVFTFNVALKIL